MCFWANAIARVISCLFQHSPLLAHYKGTILYHTIPYSTLLYSTILYGTVLHCTALHCTALHCTALHCTALHCTALHCTALHCTVLYCTVLYCTVLYCTVLCVFGLMPLLVSSRACFNIAHFSRTTKVLSYTIPYYTQLYYTLLDYTIQYYIILYHTIPSYTVLYCIFLYGTTLYRIILYSTLLYSTLLYSTLLYCTVLYRTMCFGLMPLLVSSRTCFNIADFCKNPRFRSSSAPFGPHAHLTGRLLLHFTGCVGSWCKHPKCSTSIRQDRTTMIWVILQEALHFDVGT